MANKKPHVGDVAVMIGCVLAAAAIIIIDLQQSGALQRVFSSHPVHVMRAP